MRVSRNNNTKASLAGMGLLLVALSTACGLSPAGLLSPETTDASPVGQTTSNPTVVPSSTSPTPQPPRGTELIPVKRDSITEVLAIDGLVAAQDQVPISYPGHGTVEDIKVKVGQVVSQGDPLLHLNGVELSRSLDTARARSQTSLANMAQAQAQAAARAQTSAQRSAADRTQQQQAVEDAQAGLRHAQDNLAKVQAGATDADRRAAQTSIDTAQAALGKAQDAQTKLQAGADAATLRDAQREITNDQIALSKAQADLATMLKGPDPLVVSQAQASIKSAQLQVQVLQAAKIDPKAPDPTTAKAQHDQAVADAELSIQVAQDRLVKLNQPPVDSDVQAAKQRLQDAQTALDGANAKMESLQAGPDDTALGAAQAVVDVAQQNVTDAQGRQAAIGSHPTPSELADAQDQMRKASTALTGAQNAPITDPNSDPGGVDFTALQAAVDQDQADVASLEQELDKTVMVAPFDGIVVSVRTKPGAVITSASPVFVLAKPGAPIVQADLADQDVSRVVVGQVATISLDGANDSSTHFQATVASVTPAAKDGSTAASAAFSVQWADDTSSSKFGTPVAVQLTLQQKQNVLVVPNTALHQAGARTYVQVMVGAARKVANVQVGLKGADSTEILSGLSEGQMLLVGNA